MSKQIKIITLEEFLKRGGKENQGVFDEQFFVTVQSREELRSIQYQYHEIRGILYLHAPATTLDFSPLENCSSLETAQNVKELLERRNYKTCLFFKENNIKVITYKKGQFLSRNQQDLDSRGWYSFYLTTLAQVFGPER